MEAWKERYPKLYRDLWILAIGLIVADVAVNILLYYINPIPGIYSVFALVGVLIGVWICCVGLVILGKMAGFFQQADAGKQGLRELVRWTGDPSVREQWRERQLQLLAPQPKREPLVYKGGGGERFSFGDRFGLVCLAWPQPEEGDAYVEVGWQFATDNLHGEIEIFCSPTMFNTDEEFRIKGARLHRSEPGTPSHYIRKRFGRDSTLHFAVYVQSDDYNTAPHKPVLFHPDRPKPVALLGLPAPENQADWVMEEVEKLAREIREYVATTEARTDISQELKGRLIGYKRGTYEQLIRDALERRKEEIRKSWSKKR